jgi:hypothetical protein
MEDKAETPDKEINGWTNEIEEAVQANGHEVMAKKFMHMDFARSENNWHHALLWAGILLGAAEAIVSGIGMILHPEGPTLIPIISCVLGALTTGVCHTIKRNKFAENSVSNRKASAQYTSLESNIRRQLGRPREKRQEQSEYTTWLEDTLKTMNLGAPLLPKRFHRRFEKFAAEKGIPIPAEQMHMIHINPGYEKAVVYTLTDNTDIVIQTERPSDPGSQDSLTPDSNSILHASDMPIDGRTTALKRTKTLGNYHDLSVCSDAVMNYQLKRLGMRD